MKNFLPHFLFMVCEIFAVIAYEIWNQTALAIVLGVLGAVVWLVSAFLMGRMSAKEKDRLEAASTAPAQ